MEGIQIIYTIFFNYFFVFVWWKISLKNIRWSRIEIESLWKFLLVYTIEQHCIKIICILVLEKYLLFLESFSYTTLHMYHYVIVVVN